MKTPVFTGSATAMVTPYTDKGIDYDSLAQLLERQTVGGTAAVLMCATTGEAATLKETERQEILRFTLRQVKGRMKVLCGIGSNNTDAAAAMAHTAESLGADAVLLTTPYYNKGTPEGLYRHFCCVADQCSLPLIVYNVPGRTSVACTPELYERLAEHPRINGVKEASGNISLVSQTRRRCGEDLNIWSGNDDQTLPMLALGAKGVISVASNLIPRQMRDLCGAALAGDYLSARSIHETYAILFEQLFCEVNPIPVKTALHAMGLCPDGFRLPLCSMGADNKAALLQTLRQLELLS
ncbi:MAG: 4-hydroxy-tetrahydrodipicolinate synthase [Oscillospiraceae bacterium]|nr:4-hydroxy-tetrahydrodipicolinate synthase [Oscillospiraceae bacterium]